MCEKTGQIFHNTSLFVLTNTKSPQMHILYVNYSHTLLIFILFFNFLDYEGRTGMAAIVLKRYHTFNGEKLYKHVENFLPSYAQPRFVRIMVRQSVVSHLYLSSV